MKLFYDACHSAIVHSQYPGTLGTTMWLETAFRHHQRLVKQARARLELRTVTMLDDYMRMTLKAVQGGWANRRDLTFLALVTEETMLAKVIELFEPGWSPWDKTVEGGSLPQRWA